MSIRFMMVHKGLTILGQGKFRVSSFQFRVASKEMELKHTSRTRFYELTQGFIGRCCRAVVYSEN